MTDWNNLFYLSVVFTALLLSVLGIWFTAIIPGLDRWSKRFFLIFFSIFLLCSVSSFAELVIEHYPSPDITIYLIMLLESLFLSLPLPMLTIYLLHCCGENLRRSKLLHAVLGLWGLFLVISICSSFIKGFGYIDADNQFIRGPLYPFLVIPLFLIQLVNFIGMIRRRTRLSSKVFLSFLIAILPMTAALTVQMFTDVFPLLDISIILCALSMYSFVLSDQIEQE